MTGVGQSNCDPPVNDAAVNSRGRVSEPRRSTGPSVIPLLLMLIGAGLTAAIVGIDKITLGVEGEWVWTRQPFPEDLTSFLDRSLPAFLAATILAGYAWILDRRIADFGRGAIAVALFVLTLLTGYWQSSVLQSASSPHRELRPLWVLYDKYATGYFLQALQEQRPTRQVLRDYEREMAEGDVLHKGTHPPGLFLFNRLALWCTASTSSAWTYLPNLINAQSITTFRRLEAEAALAPPLQPPQFAALILTSIVSFWFSACLPASVFLLLSRLTFRRDAWRLAVLAATLPAISVFQPRSDVLYATSGVIMLTLLIVSLQQRTLISCLLYSGLTGCWIFGCLLLSLAHIPVVLAAVLYCGFSIRITPQPSKNAGRQTGVTAGANSETRTQAIRTAVTAAGTSVSFLSGLCLFSVGTGCNMLSVWVWNLKNHAAFYGQFSRTWWKWLPVNVVEMLLSIGLPLGLIVVYRLICNRWQNRPTPYTTEPTTTGNSRAFSQDHLGRQMNSSALRQLSISLALTWILLLVSGKNMGEAARLWCFITPWWLVLLADVGLPGITASNSRKSWAWLFFFQLLVCAMTTARVSGYLQM